MTKRRSNIKQAINKAIYTGKKDYWIVYIDRSREHGVRLSKVQISRIIRVTEWAIYLDDDWTVIPLHRIKEIVDEEGKIIWRRSGDEDTK